MLNVFAQLKKNLQIGGGGGGGEGVDSTNLPYHLGLIIPFHYHALQSCLFDVVHLFEHEFDLSWETVVFLIEQSMQMGMAGSFLKECLKG